MPHKSVRYYANTVLLKAAGIFYHVFPRANSDDEFFHASVEPDARKSPGEFEMNYATFAYFNEPNDLGRHLKMVDGIAWHRIESNLNGCSPFYPSYYGLVCFNYYLKTANHSYLEQARAQLNTLLVMGTETADGFFLKYPDPLPKFLVKGGWYAGITQATMLSLALRFYKTAPDTRLEEIIHKLVFTLSLPRQSGGILINTPEGLPWIEEYPGEKPSYVLNGFIFCIVALLEYEIMFPDRQTRAFTNSLIDSLLKSLRHYRRGNYIKYSRLYPTLSNIEYQGLYVTQFRHLYLLTGLDVFSNLSKLCDSQISWPAFEEFFQLSLPVPQNKQP